MSRQGALRAWFLLQRESAKKTRNDITLYRAVFNATKQRVRNSAHHWYAIRIGYRVDPGCGVHHQNGVHYCYGVYYG